MANTYYIFTISGVRTEHYAFFDGGATVVIIEDDTKYQASPNTRSEATVQGMGATSITESAYNSYVDNAESYMRIGAHPPAKP